MDLKIKSIKKRLFEQYPFFGVIIDTVSYIETRNCLDFNGNPTVATNGNVIYYHPDFIEHLMEEELLFVFAHEIVHIAFDHVKRGKDKDEETWNIAADAVTNAFLKKDGLKPVKGAVDIPWAKKYNVEEVYRRLLKKKRRKKQKEQPHDVGHDTHRFWNEFKLETEATKIIEEAQKQFVELGEKEVLQKKTPSQTKELLEKMKQLIKSVSKKEDMNKHSSNMKGAGTETLSQKLKFDSVGIHEPLINWPMILKKPVEIVELDWSYQNAYLEDGVVSANLEESTSLHYYETEILLDTSSSISDELLRTFLRECKCILNFSKIKVGCFDTKFYGFQEIRSMRDIEEFTFVGRGGTNFCKAVESFSKTADVKIIFTDGEAYMPPQKLDIIWVVFGEQKIKPNGGQVIYVETEKLVDFSRKEKVLEKRWKK